MIYPQHCHSEEAGFSWDSLWSHLSHIIYLTLSFFISPESLGMPVSNLYNCTVLSGSCDRG